VNTPFDEQDARARMQAAHEAIARWMAIADETQHVALRLALRRASDDLKDAARHLEQAQIVYARIENTLTIVEWQINRIRQQLEVR
jgi:hypothetical protein